MQLMVEHVKKHQTKTQTIQQLLDEKNPIDQQILALMTDEKISIDVIPLDNPPEKPKKQKK